MCWHTVGRRVCTKVIMYLGLFKYHVSKLWASPDSSLLTLCLWTKHGFEFCVRSQNWYFPILGQQNNLNDVWSYSGVCILIKNNNFGFGHKKTTSYGLLGQCVLWIFTKLTFIPEQEQFICMKEKKTYWLPTNIWSSVVIYLLCLDPMISLMLCWATDYPTLILLNIYWWWSLWVVGGWSTLGMLAR